MGRKDLWLELQYAPGVDLCSKLLAKRKFCLRLGDVLSPKVMLQEI